MVRATHAGVLIRYGGTLPVGWEEAAITALCTVADTIIDGYTAPDTISTTDVRAIAIAESVVMRHVRITDSGHQSSGTTSLEGRAYPDFPELSTELKQRIDAMLTGSSTYGMGIINMIED